MWRWRGSEHLPFASSFFFMSTRLFHGAKLTAALVPCTTISFRTMLISACCKIQKEAKQHRYIYLSRTLVEAIAHLVPARGYCRDEQEQKATIEKQPLASISIPSSPLLTRLPSVNLIHSLIGPKRSHLIHYWERKRDHYNLW